MSADRDGEAYPFAEIEARWRHVWESSRLFEAEPSDGSPKWYVMELPPFANGTLHLGHVRNYAIADASARFHRQLGARVLYTSGFDTFGLPNETAAAEAGCHPKDLADKNVALISEQFRRLGLSHDRRRITDYGEPQFYAWVQWVFLRLFEAGMAYRSRREVNWCRRCGSSVEDGLVTDAGGCWRCGGALELRLVGQWFIRETAFADAVLEGLASLDRWPDSVKDIQRRFVGKSEGIVVRGNVIGHDAEVEIFVERPELLPAAEYLAVGPEHSLLSTWRDAGVLDGTVSDQLAALRRAPAAPSSDRQVRRTAYANRDVISLGVSIVHPLTGQPLPVVVLTPWTALPDDAFFGVPGHDKGNAAVARDLELSARRPSGSQAPSTSEKERQGHDVVVTPGPFCDMSPGAVREAVISQLCKGGRARLGVRYALRDWPFSRQRYWGAPIPVVHCPGCGPVAVPDADLPVCLPLDIDFLSSPSNPLPRMPEFVSTTCPACRQTATRDIETLGAYSSPWWYTWSAKDPDAHDPFTDRQVRYWQPVDLMVGGIEQSTTCFFHARTVARALAELGVVDHIEPITEVLALGMVCSNGVKMSKSTGNAVPIDGLLARYGADALRLAVLGAAAPNKDFDWSDTLIIRQYRWLTRVWRFIMLRRGELVEAGPVVFIDEGSKPRRALARRVGTAVAKATSGLYHNAFHLVVKDLSFLFARLKEFDDAARRVSGHLFREDVAALAVGLRSFVQMLGPLAPHLAEELWSAMGEKQPLSAGGWPGASRPA